MRGSKIKLVPLAIALGLNIQTGYAAEEYVGEHLGMDLSTGPAEGIAPGFYPAISVNYSSDSNVAKTPTNPVSDTSITAEPSLYYRSSIGRHGVDLSAVVKSSQFKDLSSQDVNDYAMIARLGLDITPIIQVNLGVGTETGTDDRDVLSNTSTNPEDLRSLPAWKQNGVGGEVIVGRRDARMQVGVRGMSSTYRYDDEVDRVLDRDRQSATVTAYYNLTGRTTAMLEGTSTDIDYTDPASHLDSTEDSLMAGLRVGGRMSVVRGLREESRRRILLSGTRGEIKVGSMNKDMADPAIEDFDGTIYHSKVVWEPTRRNSVELVANRTPAESADKTQAYYVGDYLGLSASHDLTGRLRTNAYVGNLEQDYATSVRNDETNQYGVGLKYQAKRWLHIGLSYGHEERDSNIDAANYDNDSVTLEFIAGRI